MRQKPENETHKNLFEQPLSRKNNNFRRLLWRSENILSLSLKINTLKWRLKTTLNQSICTTLPLPTEEKSTYCNISTIQSIKRRMGNSIGPNLDVYMLSTSKQYAGELMNTWESLCNSASSKATLLWYSWPECVQFTCLCSTSGCSHQWTEHNTKDKHKPESVLQIDSN